MEKAEIAIKAAKAIALVKSKKFLGIQVIFASFEDAKRVRDCEIEELPVKEAFIPVQAIECVAFKRFEFASFFAVFMESTGTRTVSIPVDIYL